jgi:hypothetical protein
MEAATTALRLTEKLDFLNRNILANKQNRMSPTSKRKVKGPKFNIPQKFSEIFTAGKCRTQLNPGRFLMLNT